MEKIGIKLSNGTEFDAELADTVFKQVKGLSFRSSGKMLFVFSSPTGANIDMMFLSRPLHLYFMNPEKEVIDVQRAEPWGLDPRSWKLYSPDRRYQYLLESFEELGLEEGEQVEFEL